MHVERTRLAALAVPAARATLATVATIATLAAMVLGLAGLAATAGAAAITAASTAAPSAAVEPAVAGLAAAALSADTAAAPAAVEDLRRAGPDAVPALLAAQAEHPVDDARFRERLDQVCAQRDCAASRLFWYTDLERAKAAALRTGRPILSLRLLGRLDEEMSCANSRFFRTVLYGNEEVSRLLREGFVLHWSSERPVPKVTIDFGDGRALKGTITGNSIHYVLDPRGRLVDALPGLYGPRAFQRLLEIDRQQALGLSPLDDAAFAYLLSWFHQGELVRIDADLDRDAGVVGASPQAARGERRRPRSGVTPTAYDAANLAMTKSSGEIVPLAALSIAGRQQKLAGIDWERIASLHGEDWALDARSVAELERKQAARDPDRASRRGAIRRFQRLVGVDTVRNEGLFHAVLHAWLGASHDVEDLDRFNERVYADLFLTPRSDPWLGLAAPETFMALEPTAPQQAASTDVIKGWVESQKGLGSPEYLDSVQKDMRVFVAWNIPTSGFNGTDFWVYCQPDAISKSKWHLEVSSQFVPAGDQAHSAVVVPALHELRFLGKDGQIYHRVSLASCVAQPHGDAGPPG